MPATVPLKGLTPGRLRLHYAPSHAIHDRAATADRWERNPVSRPRAADDFETIRARLDELRRERAASAPDEDARSGTAPSGKGESDSERRRRARMEGLPPPWVPTIFVNIPRL